MLLRIWRCASLILSHSSPWGTSIAAAMAGWWDSLPDNRRNGFEDLTAKKTHAELVGALPGRKTVLVMMQAPIVRRDCARPP